MSIDYKRDNHWHKSIPNFSLMSDNPENALLNAKKTEIYKKDKEDLIRGYFRWN